MSRTALVSRREKWTALPKTLIVLPAVGTVYLWPFHINPQIFPDKVNCLQDREIRIPFAAPGTSDFSDSPKRTGGHLMGKSEIILSQRRGARGQAEYGLRLAAEQLHIALRRLPG